MAFQTGRMTTNPRLGIYFSIFAALVIGLFFFLLIMEQLGTTSRLIRLMMIGGPLALFALIAVLTFTLDVADFFVVGRRVPAFVSGLGIAIVTLGSVGAVWATGLLFHTGFDGLAVIIGLMAGLVLLGLVVAPYYRKLGAYSVSGFLGARFGSRSIRVVSAFLMTIPCLLFLLAEIKIGSKILAMMIDRGELIAVTSFIITLIFMIIWGGVRGLVWTNGAQGIVSVIALLVLPMVAALLLTNLPLPQITYGTLLGDLARFERDAGIDAVTPSGSDLNGLLDGSKRAIGKPFLQTFGFIGRLDFLMIIMTIMAGIVSAPHLIGRMTISPGVAENRKSLGWACLILGLVLLTLPAIAVFVRYEIFEHWVGRAPNQLPDILDMFKRSGLFGVSDQVGRLSGTDIHLSPDGVLLIFPVIMDFPNIFSYFLMSSLVGLALAAGSAQLMTLSTLLTVDVGFISAREAQHSVFQTIIVRVIMVLVGSVAGWFVLKWRVDPVNLLFYGLQISAAVGFPIMVMSIWWKRLNVYGALAGMIAGAVVGIGYIIIVGTGTVQPVFGVDPRLSAVFGVPFGFVFAVIASLLTRLPTPAEIELVRDMRIPGGETLYDRTIRYARLKAQREKAH